MNRFFCKKCNIDTLEIKEYYMVKNEIWKKVNPELTGMLCITCLERKLGRQLKSEDFTDCLLNKRKDKSSLLLSRLNN